MKPDMKARLSLLHKSESEWHKLATFVPFSGEVIVFDPDTTHNYARLKIGDGKTLLKDLPFFIDSVIDDHAVIDGGRISKQ